jgi:hypothetical protein
LEDDLQRAREYLVQARFDFGKANNNEFVAKAEAHLKAIDFQIKMRDLVSGVDSRLSSGQQEVAAEAIVALLSHGLVEEASKLLNLIFPFVSAYNKMRLLKVVAPKIPIRYE